jgi:hypothetical protein
MNLLASLQDRFQRGLLDGDDNTLTDIVDSAKTTRDILFGVYKHAYGARLVEIIRHDFERMHAWLGDETFDDMARAYVESHPSRHANARWYSRDLPDFLETAAPFRDAPVLAELALLERALNDAFDADDAPVLQLDALAWIAPERWSGLRFRPHPSATRINLRTNAAAIWIALKDECTPPPAAPAGSPVRLLVWRQDFVPKFRDIADEEAMMWAEAAAGVPFGVLCEMLSFRSDPGTAPLRAATLLQGWIAGGLVSEVE